jgi:hypothetical protein
MPRPPFVRNARGASTAGWRASFFVLGAIKLFTVVPLMLMRDRAGRRPVAPRRTLRQVLSDSVRLVPAGRPIVRGGVGSNPAHRPACRRPDHGRGRHDRGGRTTGVPTIATATAKDFVGRGVVLIDPWLRVDHRLLTAERQQTAAQGGKNQC